ncbi:MAG: tetratricopeptide repeat protein [Acidobacteria bacterium]|nr:tetratricopeptide repeat protein [Acidobacteriota bacterium]
MRIDVQLHDARTGQLLAAESLMVDQPRQILAQVDLLSLKLASHLGAGFTQQDTKTSLASVMTDNLEAYRYSSLAVEKAQAYHRAEAIELLEKAIALDPHFAMAYARIGYTYGVTWAFAEKARPYLEKAFRLSDHLTERDRLYIAAWYAIAHLDPHGAARAFREIIAKYPLEIEASLGLGGLLWGEQRFEEAISVVQQALVIDPDAKEVRNMLGLFHSALGDHDKAVAMHQQYVTLAPNEPNAHDSLGMSYQWAGRYHEAINEYHRALDLNPEFEVAVIHLGNVYFQQGRYREAMGQHQRYIQLDEAIAEYECILRLNPNYPLAHYHLGQAYERKGQRARARAAFVDIHDHAFVARSTRARAGCV